jgi:hypothetical protein
MISAVRPASPQLHERRLRDARRLLRACRRHKQSSNQAIQALIGHAREFPGSGFLVPTRNTQLFRWCLAQGLRVVQPMTLMSAGLYNEPAGAFLPSVTY